MPIECLISFDNNPQGVYYAGHELSGVVDLRVDTTKRIKAIHITVSGYAKVRWIKKGYPRDSERAMCRAYRSYLSSRSYVLGTCASNSIIDWTAGEYSYTFHVILPENLPTSFDGKYGQIHYEIITTIDRQARYAKIFKLPFTVIHPLDLNADAMYRVPLEILNRKRFWSFCCPTGPLTVKFSTPYCGYAPGQKIHFVLYINNESSIDVTACEVKLKQEVIYESHDPQHEYRYDKHLIARKQFGNVLRWSRKVYRGYLDLPSIPPSSARMIGSCPIMVNYAIKIIVNPTEFHWKMKLKVPLTIGSIPIMDSQLAVNEAYLDDTMRRHARLAQEQHQHQDQPEDGQQRVANDNYNNNNNNNNNNTSMGRHSPNVQPPQIRSNQQTIQRQTTSSTPTILVTDGDNPPDYVAMMPPSYEDAMALSDKFFDDTEFLQNISLSSITSNTKPEPYKPRYPVYYEYETPTIPPELLYDETPAQLRIALEIESTTTVTEDGTESIDINSSAANLSILRNFEKI